jgi:glycyl-tRNA synthetase beta chain
MPHAVRAAELSKCDLTTELVKEFTELQGVVGGLYARAQGEPEPVWQAIYDHYKPESMEDAIPRHRTAQIVALADKLDTLRGCFRVGLIPTGSRDPFALRRAAQGVVKILVEGKMDRSRRCRFPDGQRTAFKASFFADRVRSTSRITAASSTTKSTPPWPPAGATWWTWKRGWSAHPEPARHARFRAAGRQLQAHPQHSGAGGISRAAGPSTRSLLEAGPELELYEEFRRIAASPSRTPSRALRPKVDLFFDKVLVNAPDAASGKTV